MHYSSDPAASDLGVAEVCGVFDRGEPRKVRAGRKWGIKLGGVREGYEAVQAAPEL